MTLSHYSIPYWCGMSGYEHFDGMGGCWGISSGRVSERGRDYCRCCTFYKKTVKRVGRGMAWMPSDSHGIPLARQRNR